MDAWRQEKLMAVSNALSSIDRRTSKLVTKINASPVGTWHNDNKVSGWTNEVARLQDMSDRLLGFKGKLYVYSNLAYVEAVREWDHEIKKICSKADRFRKGGW